MVDPRRLFGNKGEADAAAYLKKKGLVVTHRQYTTPFGEIDLVCRDGDEVVFVEVKTRRTRTFGYPEDSVTVQKLKHIVRSAEHALEKESWTQKPWRVDVVSVEYENKKPVCMHLIGIDIPDDFC